MLGVVCPPGDHEYVPPPVDELAVSVAVCPAQMVDEFTVTVVAGFTVTAAVAELVHPLKEYVTV